MAFTNLPPQAYTRDVLAAAYEWLRSQPTSIRELATNSDNLVSLYMQSRRRPNSLNQFVTNSADGGAISSGEVVRREAAESFKNDLKNLAEGLRQFEDPRAAQAQATEPFTEPLPTPQAPQTVSVAHATPAPSTPIANSAPISSQSPMPTAGLSLDPRSLDTVRKVQSLFNLGSEREAVRLLIAVGFEKVKDFIAGP